MEQGQWGGQELGIAQPYPPLAREKSPFQLFWQVCGPGLERAAGVRRQPGYQSDVEFDYLHWEWVEQEVGQRKCKFEAFQIAYIHSIKNLGLGPNKPDKNVKSPGAHENVALDGRPQEHHKPARRALPACQRSESDCDGAIRWTVCRASLVVVRLTAREW